MVQSPFIFVAWTMAWLTNLDFMLDIYIELWLLAGNGMICIFVLWQGMTYMLCVFGSNIVVSVLCCNYEYCGMEWVPLFSVYGLYTFSYDMCVQQIHVHGKISNCRIGNCSHYVHERFGNCRTIKTLHTITKISLVTHYKPVNNEQFR